ncbi:MAG: hypothetical protein Q8O00_00460 [Holophaga sp.]|nr:hypothetical protein [Holophaga sp.]
MTLDVAMHDLARALLAVGTPPAEVLELLIGQAWTAVLITCRPTPPLLSEILTEMAKELDTNRFRPRVARMALESAGIDPLLLALHADRICKKGDPLVLAKILARGLGVPEAMVKRISTGWWTPSVFFPLPFPDLGVDLEGLSDEEAQALRDALGSGQ